MQAAEHARAARRRPAAPRPGPVVPADRKWYRNWAITQLLIEELEAMALDGRQLALGLDGGRRGHALVAVGVSSDFFESTA